RLLDVHRKRALRAAIHVHAPRENRKAFAEFCGRHATTSRAEPRILRYAADMIRRNGRNSGMLYRRPSTKNVVDAIARRATIPAAAANSRVGSVSGSRSRTAAGAVRRNCTYVTRITIQMNSMPATAVPYSARNGRAG